MSEQYLDRLDWPRLEQQLDQDGCAVIPDRKSVV